MEKTKNKKYLQMIIIFLIFMFIIGLVMNFSNVHAAIEDTAEHMTSDDNNISNFIKQAIGLVLNSATGPLSKALGLLVNLFSGLLFAILYLVFVASGIIVDLRLFPWPDNIIFNRVAFFDPNFINPTTTSSAPVNILQDTIKNLYYSCFTIAITIFVIAALVIGIKLAISSIASEKAQYKEALKNWIMGIVLLFTVHFLMAGIFKINEAIVNVAYKTVNQGVTFDIPVTDYVPVVGTTLTSMLKSSMNFLNGLVGSKLEVPTVPIEGFGGFTTMLVLKGVLNFDFMYSIMLAMLIFQTVALIVVYVKRLFYCIFLGILAPVVVAADVIKKSIG